MHKIIRSSERGYANHGWLESFHTFSFANYYNPEQIEFRSLRVINQDRIQPKQGFGTHSHRDMEIITYMLSGTLAHKDSMSNERLIQAGELQYMSAGKGVTHSEYNASDSVEAQLLQIWIKPAQLGLEPRYAEWKPDHSSEKDPLLLLVSGENQAGKIHIQQDTNIYRGRLVQGQVQEFKIAAERAIWLQMITGELSIAGEILAAGDAIAITDQSEFTWQAQADSHYLLFDLA